MSTDADAIVVGAGIAGSVTAILLAAAGYRVQLLERAPPRISAGDVRTLAISPAARQLLERTGLDWSTTDAQPYRRMEVFDAGSVGHLAFDANDVDDDDGGSAATEGAQDGALGYIVSHGQLAAVLWALASSHADIVVQAGATVSGLQRADDHWRLQLDSGQNCEAPLIIAADGGQSAVRSLAGGSVRVQDSGQCAIATIVTHALPHDDTAVQIFLPSGPLALLPMRPEAGQRRTSVVWSLDADALPPIAALDATAFCAHLDATIASCVDTSARFGRIESCAARATFPLVQQHAQRYQPAEGIVLIGDAAHTVHPLAGQGMNLGLRDVRLLVETLGEGTAGRDLAAALDRFERRARTTNTGALLLFDALRRTYAEQGPWWRFLRSRGMRLVDEAPALKRQLAREAMGFGFLR